ncbi:glutathione S-transferase [Thalassotalea fonticola]|uniref:Glutathione S-transferase n=1 Tax=Thalassotalea fonticola TaxID=3065649 RepID=A0ABZ0GTH3_9GAMM|nr:glutathione S-transferase [Colwelliaceae bacterium S1-1]
MTLPVLYSLRNCPYAMRARLAIYKSKQPIELRDVVLTNKPKAMISASAKGTVPILVLTSEHVIDESLDVMLWALNESDPDDLLHGENSLTDILNLIHQFDDEFKTCLEQYKCAKRYHESNLSECRQACEVYLKDLELRLTDHDYIIDEKESLADIALLPFIRQFAKIERQWYLQSPYPNVKRWLNRYLQSAMFTKVMAKYPLWSENSEITVFTG